VALRSKLTEEDPGNGFDVYMKHLRYQMGGGNFNHEAMKIKVPINLIKNL